MIKIKHRWNGKVLYTAENATDTRQAVKEAVQAGADLTGADLAHANLARANLAHADLTGADLAHADLTDAYLVGANLAHANLADAKGIHPDRTDDLRILLDQPGKVRAYKLVNKQGEGPFNGGITYEIGETYEADADTDETRQCGAGINLATLPWCLQNWRPGYRILVCEFSAKDAVVPHFTDGKFRCSRVRVVKELEIDPVGLGLVSDARNCKPDIFEATYEPVEPASHE